MNEQIEKGCGNLGLGLDRSLALHTQAVLQGAIFWQRLRAVRRPRKTVLIISAIILNCCSGTEVVIFPIED